MKCFEITKCSDEARKTCIVWKTYKDIPAEMENIKCWVIKGVYQEENRAQLQKCRKCPYYLKIHQNTGVNANLSSDIAVVTCEGSINNDKTRALDQVWASLKKNGKFKILMDISNVTNIYSCGLGELIKIHKETEANSGVLLLVGAQDTVKRIISGTKLDRILKFAADQDTAVKFFQDMKKKELDAIEAAKKPAPPPPRVVKERVACWVYWKGKNPKNAMPCSECYRKITDSKDPCWIVEGMVEGILFQYVNEECTECEYFREFSESEEITEKHGGEAMPSAQA